jgi:hypothetical protein
MLDYLGMMGLEQVKSTCNPGFQREQMRQRLNRRVPPTLSEECEEMLAQLAGSTLEATNNELAQMFPANADNPMNPANDPEGAAVPDINVNGALLVVRLVRQFFGNNNPERGRFDEFLMRAAIISELILGIVQGIEQNRQAINGAAAAFLTVRMAKEMIKKVSSKQAECSRNLICLKDDCKGTMELKPLLGFLGESQTFQTGRCTTVSSPIFLLFFIFTYDLTGVERT